MTQSLGARQAEYESVYDYKIPRKIPVIIKTKLLNYKRLTQNLDKPYSLDFLEVMAQTAMYAISQIQDAVFGFVHNDEIIFILKNDKELDYQPWLGNNIQGIASETSSFLTNGFIKSLRIFGEDLDLVGDAVFKAHVFSSPNVSESVSYIIYRQDSCIKNALNRTCSFELEDQFGAEKASTLFTGKSYDEKEEMLQRFCGIDFYKNYPPNFIYGTALYKIPTVVRKNNQESMTRNRWYIDDNISNIIDDKSFISAIIANGRDILRAEDIIDR